MGCAYSHWVIHCMVWTESIWSGMHSARTGKYLEPLTDGAIGWWCSVTWYLPVVPGAVKTAKSSPVTFLMSIVVNIGMWFERFDHRFFCVSRDFRLPGGVLTQPAIYEIGFYLGYFRFVLHLLLPVSKYFPCIAILRSSNIENDWWKL